MKRTALTFSLIAATQLGTLAGACSGSDDPPPSNTDAGDIDAESPPSSDGGLDGRAEASTDPDSGTPDSGREGLESKLLVAGDIALIGVTSEDRAIYIKTTGETRSLEAIPLGGGAVITIIADLAADTRVAVEGGAVGIWTHVDEATSVGTFGFWTRNGGLHLDVAANSHATYFRANQEGVRIAFFTDATIASGKVTRAALSVATAFASTTTPVFAGADAIAFDDGCIPRVAFAGDNLLATYCAPGAATARLALISDFSAPAARVLVADGLESKWSADHSGSNVFVATKTNKEGSVVTTSAPSARTTIEAGIEQGFMLRDGSAVVYRAGTTLKRALVDGPGAPITMATGAAHGIIEVSSNTVLYNTLPGTPLDPKEPNGDRFVDLHVVPTNATSATPKTLVGEARTFAIGLTADGSHALFLWKGFKLGRVKLADAVESTMPPSFQSVTTAPSGAGVVLGVNTRQAGTKTVCDLEFVDFTRTDGATPAPFAEGAPSGMSFRFGVANTKQVAYVRLEAAQPGLYVTDLP